MEVQKKYEVFKSDGPVVILRENGQIRGRFRGKDGARKSMARRAKGTLRNWVRYGYTDIFQDFGDDAVTISAQQPERPVQFNLHLARGLLEEVQRAAHDRDISVNQCINDMLSSAIA